jgi:hypothetical protein
MISPRRSSAFTLEERNFLLDALSDDAKCFTCKTASSVMWHKGFFDDSQNLCQECHDAETRAFDFIEAPKKIQPIARCNTNTHTAIPPPRLNNFRLKKQDTPPNTVEENLECFTCKTASSVMWHKGFFDDSQNLCQRCHDAQTRAFDYIEAPKKICSIPTCLAKSSSHWYTNKGNTICQKCYHIQRQTLSITGALGRTCSNLSCQTTATRQWYKDFSSPEKYKCEKCYRHETYRKNNPEKKYITK